ncbi:MAG: hypothetical protein ACRDNY_03775 [Gaiellaceae bacterium]
MRIVFVGLLAAVALTAVTSAPAQVARHAALGVVDTRPFVARGTGFQPNERVVVRLASGRVWIRAVVASARGSFTTRFPTSLARCRRFTVQAFGSLGSRARLYSGLRLDCEPRRSGLVSWRTTRA